MAHALQHDGIEIAETKTYAKTILQSGETLLTLLNDILDLAALESHKASLLNIDFRLLDILNPVKDLFTFNTNNQTLIVESIDSKLCDARYRGDPIRIRQMLSNFVHNAIKFAPQGDIRIGCQEVESDGSHALIEFFVLDQGEGIPAEKLKVIFDPFTQITNNSTNTSGGTGLGLAIVRDLAHLMGGDAGCESSQFFGSRFYFRVRLPIVVQPIPLTNESDQSTKIPVSKDMTGTVLIADDNKINRIVIETLLLQQGITTFSVVNGKQALGYIESGARPSLILMDCQMPVMDGYDATGQIRLWESANQQLRVPIVALTAAAFNYDRQRCTDAGMDDYLSKPISLTALHEVLTRWIGTEKIQAN
jgi:CheY-like chemotaxis protein